MNSIRMLCLVVFFTASYEKALCQKNLNIEKYKIAYNYIKNDTLRIESDNHENKYRCISVSKIIAPLWFTAFSDSIFAYGLYPDFTKPFDLRLFLSKEEMNTKQYELPDLKKMSDCANDEVLVFFSEIKKDRILLAEVANNRRCAKGYRDVVSFNTSLLYLFVFDENNNLWKVIHTRTLYD